jgi:guanylate kinase
VADRGHLFLLIGPSGSGKTTLIQEMCRRFAMLRFLPTVTTRAPRSHEVNGREYDFVSAPEFEALIRDGALLEWQEIHGNWYGTSRLRIADAIDRGVFGITSVDVLGGTRVRAAFPADSTAIFVRPSSVAELRERLLARGGASQDDIEVRLARVEMEMAQAGQSDYTVVNDNGRLSQAADHLSDILAKRLGPPDPAAAGSLAPTGPKE